MNLTEPRTLGGFSLSVEVDEDKAPRRTAQVTTGAASEATTARGPGTRARAKRMHRK
jgi:hypothetical protein